MPDKGDFLDSNVICYLFGADPAKADRAGELLALQPTISVQVLAEVCNVAHRKAKLTWAEIEDIIDVISALCVIVPVTAEIQAEARVLAARTGYTIYDAQILAAAAAAGCALVWSEDLQDGHKMAGLGHQMVIRNPFVGEDEGRG
jgi:predicted nucleic acid-binding protein